jgi:AraC-like DNA-binding protein
MTMRIIAGQAINVLIFYDNVLLFYDMTQIAVARVRAGIVTTMLQFIAGTGVNTSRVRLAAGIRSGDLMDPDRELDLDCLAAAFQAASDEIGDPAFILRVSAGVDLEALGLISYIVLNASTVGTGVRNLDRFAGTFVEGLQIKLVREQGEVVLRISVTGLSPPTAPQIYEGGALLIVRMLQRLTGDPQWQPLALLFAHASPRSITPYKTYFGITPQFGAHDYEIRIDERVMSQEVLDADRSVLPLIAQRLQDVVARDGEPDWLVRLKYLIASRLCDGHPSLADVAPELGLTPRTLQRRLESQGIFYRDLVQQARFHLAREYLVGSDIELTEIAFLLGYSELSAFAHAFKRWTGVPPGSVRNSRT